MAKYKAKAVTVAMPAEAIASKFEDLTAFQSALDKLPSDVAAKVGDVSFEKDALIINTPQLGAITLKVVERTSSRVAMSAVGSPVPLTLAVDLDAKDASETELQTAIEVEIPAMLRPLIGSKMQEAADKFGDLMGKLASNGI